MSPAYRHRPRPAARTHRHRHRPRPLRRPPLPARIASVVLQPILDLTSPALKREGKDFKPEPATKVVQTLLDGSFIIPDVHPGDYYVIAEKIGYLSPLAQLSREDLNHPTDATAKLMANLLTPVSVAANRTSTAEVHLLKGATIAGTIRRR